MRNGAVTIRVGNVSRLTAMDVATSTMLGDEPIPVTARYADALARNEQGDRMTDEQDQQRECEQPEVTDLGSLVKVTARPKKLITNSDHSFGGAPIGS